MCLHWLALLWPEDCPGLDASGSCPGSPALTVGPSLGCYPFYKSDPFIFLECPHVYFCGNAPSFGSKVVRGKFCPLGTPALGHHKGLALNWEQGSQKKTVTGSSGPVGWMATRRWLMAHANQG